MNTATPVPGTIPEEEKQEVKKAIDGTKSLSKALKNFEYDLAEAEDGGYQIAITAKKGETVRLNGESLDEMLNIGITTLSIKAPDGTDGGQTLDVAGMHAVINELRGSGLYDDVQVEIRDDSVPGLVIDLKEETGEKNPEAERAVLTKAQLEELDESGIRYIILRKTVGKEKEHLKTAIIKPIIELITDKAEKPDADFALSIDQAGDITVLIDGKPDKDITDEIAALIEKQNTEE